MAGISLSVQNLHKHFGAKQVLRGINLSLAPGEFVAVVGKSGCGKSTLLRLLAGLDTPDDGQILADHRPLTHQNQAARVVFQDARLLPWKRVLDNVALGLPNEQRGQAEATLRHMQLTDRIHQWPNVLSGGERQRVALARALVTRPPVLLLDEPLGALDALTRIEMQRLLEALWLEEQFTALLITHDVEEAVAIADRVVLITDGKISLDVAVPFARPRDRGTAEFAALKDRILRQILGEYTREPLLA
jgi:sulfonate transport system ATP-binding protein